MKLRVLLLLLLGLALISSSGVRAEETKPAAAPAKPATAGKPEKPETELEKQMAKMNKAWRQVRQAARDGKLTKAHAAQVGAMRDAAAAAAKLTPALEAEKPAADRAQFQADYQAQMKKLINTLGRLETALKVGDFDSATKLIAEVGEVRKSGHNDFKKPDDH